MTTTPPSDPLRTCAVRVPCSTSNLGAGFDCIGLAFDTYLDAGYEPGAHELSVQRAGTLRDLDIALPDDRLVLAFRAELRRRGVTDPGGTLLCTSSIPVARGLGSSAAATVAGIALATAACGDTLDRDAALASAVRLEGHPDNAAPALFGGLIAVATGESGAPLAMQLPLSPDIAFVFAASDAPVSTQRARAALPQHVPHSAAARNLGRMAALLYGLAHADAKALAIGFTDELHVPYRLPLITGGNAALKAATAAGAWGATISGSGSGLIAVCAAEHAGRVLDALRHAVARQSQASIAFIARPEMHGTQPRSFSTLRDTMRGVR
jgi:homoserine kinase